MRELKDIETGELTEALIGMLEKLEIAGSTNEYDIYKAVQDEHAKVKNHG